MMAVAEVSPELVVRNVSAFASRTRSLRLLLRFWPRKVHLLGGMFLAFRLHLIAGLIFAFWLLLILILFRFCGFGCVLMSRFSFVLLGLGLGIFLPRRFVFLLLVLRVKKGCTSDQSRQYRYIQES
jgi:hypothetical protein